MSTRDAPTRVALVTGGARRVGAAFSRALAARGFAVAVHYNNSAAEAEALVKELGNGARSFGGNLSRTGVAQDLVSRVVHELGPIDVLVNSAANFIKVPLDEVTDEVWEEVVSLNLKAPFFVSLAASKAMSDGGCIVNISDLAAFETWPEYVPHGIAKAGVVQLTRAFSRQLAPRIRVNAIVPGFILAPDDMSDDEAERYAHSTPLARNGSPEDVVRALNYFIDSTFVTGEVLFVDGGRHAR